MLAEALKELQGIIRNEQPASMTLEIGLDDGKQILLWSPTNTAYDVQAFIPRDVAIEVSEVESLASLVRREALPSGAVVIFGSSGATFLPGRKSSGRVSVVHKYTRRHSPQWSALRKALGNSFDHLGFLRMLQSLRPSIVGYAPLYSAYQRISFETGAKATSAPLVLHGDAGSTLSFNVAVKTGTAEVKLPAEFTVTIPLTRFGQPQSFPVEIDAAVSAEGKVSFSLVAPEMDVAEQTAIAEEVASFREAVSLVEMPLDVLVNL